MILLLLRLSVAYVLLCAVLGFGSAFVVPSCASVTGTRDVALVLGAGIRRDGTLSPDSATRTEAGAELYRRGLVSAVHLSGGGAVGGTTIGETMARHAMDHGVPESALSWEGRSQSTLQNAVFSLPMLPEDATIRVVTEPYHALRGAASFLAAGRPSPVCAAPRGDTGAYDWTRDRLRETAAWGLNILRGSAYGISALLGRTDALPEWALE